MGRLLARLAQLFTGCFFSSGPRGSILELCPDFSMPVRVPAAGCLRGGHPGGAGWVTNGGPSCVAPIHERIEAGEANTGPTGRENTAQGTGRRPMPWVRGDLNPAARRVARPTLKACGVDRTSGTCGIERSRGPSGRWVEGFPQPRASAFGLDALGWVLPARRAGSFNQE
jgi:hypothetical protein